jgi:dihydrofolate synthase/folylpolyglutamate synthase
MFDQLPMYQRQGPIAFKKDLTNIQALSNHLNSPEKKFPSIHVAGTNGKGSTSHMMASILQEADLKVGLYTSPHLKDFRERVRINGSPITEREVIRFIDDNKLFLEEHKLSFFEMTVGMAFSHFSDHKVDIAIVEVGLGGRLDSTNIINPLISVITNIGLDHTQFLGEKRTEIAFEKAGIIKNNIPVVIGEKQQEVLPVFEEIARKKNARIYFADNLVTDNYATDLLGDYQKINVKTAVQTIRLLNQKNFNISLTEIQEGLLNIAKNTGLKGRYQQLGSDPKIICDTAHNAEGLSLVLDQLKNEKFLKLHIVIGVVNDKNLDLILNLFPKTASYYFCKPDIPRGLDALLLQEAASRYELIGEAYESVEMAYKKALQTAKKEDLIYIGGSTFVVAELPL